MKNVKVWSLAALLAAIFCQDGIAGILKPEEMKSDLRSLSAQRGDDHFMPDSDALEGGSRNLRLHVFGFGFGGGGGSGPVMSLEEKRMQIQAEERRKVAQEGVHQESEAKGTTAEDGQESEAAENKDVEGTE